MKTLLIFTLFLISVGGEESIEVTGYSGGGVLIKCTYDTGYTSNQKYLCKGPWSNCDDQIKTGVQNEWINSGRFSLFDDTSAAQFWVVIRQLTVEDSGTYQCGVDITLAIDIFTPVELKVEEDQDYEKSINVSGHVGGSVNISCKYPQSHSSDPKFLCRRVATDACNYKTSVKQSRRWINEEKLSLHDDRAKQIFTVSFSRLTEGDSGEYWCGAESDWTSDHGYKVYITQINLTVTASLPEKETILSPPSPPSRNPQSTKLNTSSFKPSGKSSSETIAPKGLPSSSVIAVVSVILLLLLIGLLFFIVILRKRSKTQDPASTQSQPLRDFSNNHKVPTADYDQIKDTRNCSDVGVSTVYTTADLPTNVSEPSQTVYDNVQLSTNPSEPSQTVYDNVQLSTNPSEPSHAVYDNVQFFSHCDFSNPVYSPAQSPPNSPDQVIYSTPELATLLLDSSNVTQPSAEKSAEGPTYAKVNFSQKANSSTDAVTTATINNSCNYAIVKY